jgi:two-component system, cell cycle response regulator DivK
MPKTVLIVEDHPIHAKLMKDVLETTGFQVIPASNAMEAHQMAREHRPDLVIMDIQLPEISGIDLTKALKADDNLKDTPIIAVTAFASRKDAETIRQSGVSDIITKPFSIPGFLEVIVRYLGDPAKPQ